MKAIMRDKAELKKSGIKWIDDIPFNWKTAKIRNVIQSGRDGIKIGPFGSALTNKTSGDADYKIYGQANLVSGDFSDTKNKISKEVFLELKNYEVIPNDICISMMGTIGKCLTVPHGISKGIMDSHLIKIRLKENIDNRFFEYVYDKDKGGICFTQMQYEKKGSIMDGLNTTIVKGLYLPLPNFEEQQAIANYLDDRCSKIDTIIAEAKASIEEYKELKQAVIYEAVTKGLDKNVEMKDSGVEWIGQIPNYMTVKKIKYVTQISRGLFGYRPRNAAFLYDGPYPFIQTGDVARANHYITEYKQTLSEEGKKVSRLFPKGTLTMTIAANVGDVSILGFDAYFPDSVLGFIPYDKYSSEYLYYIFSAMKEEFVLNAISNTQLNLNVERVKELYIPVLEDVEQQKKLINYLDSKTEKIDEMISEKQSLIEDLEVYKKSLIYEMVTGKCKVVA